jgi:hypothetical protein
MADFFQQPDQQDPDAIRKAMLLRMFGAMTAGAQQPGLTPGAAPGVSGAPPTTTTPAAAPEARKPTAQPLASAAANNNGGNMEPGSAPPILSEADWQKQNPGAPHTPYVAPTFKQRLLEGLFAGMQEFGRPGEGARTIQNYLGDIQKNQEAEKNYPATSAADAHKRYMDYAQGQEVPLQLQNLDAQIRERQANAQAKLHPPADYGHVAILDPADPENPKAALFDKKSGAFVDPETKQAIPGAKLWEKPAAEKNLEKITVLGPDNKPHVYGVNAEGKKVQDYGVAPNQSPEAKHTAAELAQVERETRTAVRKADADYRTAESTATLQRQFIKEAKGGNREAVKIVPLEGALEITTSQGVHRINRTEVEQYGAAGNWYDKLAAIAGKWGTGKDIDDRILDDMDKMTAEVIKNAHKKYSDTYDDEMGIAQGYGLDLGKKMPKIKSPVEAPAGALPPGWK